ncbi:extensin family protein [Mesorhizobium sp. ZMM04-5]|uniref:Extensin family protein n=1 Tax=Mesorhizobium marinum TaxID=3228790 RepID=A0ABV3QUK3_9HYPH
MGKLSILRLVFAVSISGLFLFPPPDARAAPAWLEKLFQAPRDKPPKRRKPRPEAKVVTPDTAPVPTEKPDGIGEPGPFAGTPPGDPQPVASAGPDAATAYAPVSAPVPEPSPRASAETAEPRQDPAETVQEPPAAPLEKPVASDEALPQTVPVPEPNPRLAAATPDDALLAARPGPVLPDPRSAERPNPSGDLPEDEIACRQRLAELGVKFDNKPPEADPIGCSMPYPIVVSSLGSGIELQPRAEMNCAMAEAAARFAGDVVSPAAQRTFGKPLQSVAHASAYVCRPRNGSQKLSEHAFGNALDIAAFTLSGGTTIAVQPSPPERSSEFLDAVRSAACGPFKTVLGPGSDADHAEHIHLDLAPRRNGGTVCE